MTIRVILGVMLLAATNTAHSQQRDSLATPLGLARGPGNTIYWSERRGHVVRRMNLDTRVIETVAGTGQAGFSGDGGLATRAELWCPDWVDVDSRGNIYIADRCNQRIRRVDTHTGRISTVAGTGQRGRSPDGPALDRSLTGPFFLKLASDSVLLFTDTDAHLVRQINLSTGRMTTLAGNGERAYAGDNGPALEASLARPHVAIRARNGDLIIGDSFNHRWRRVDGVSGHIRTIAGSGAEGQATDSADALRSPLMYFGTVIEHNNGDLVFTEWSGVGRVLQLDHRSQRLHVIAGTTDTTALDRDGLPPRATRFGALGGLIIDDEGRLIVADAERNQIRRIDLRHQVVETLAGGR